MAMKLFMAIAALAASGAALAQTPDASRFGYGPVFAGHGPHASVAADVIIPEGTVFKHSFDGSERAEDGQNRTLIAAARFLNMHAAAGVPRENMALAVVVHGQAAQDLLTAEAYASRFDGAANPNAPLIAALVGEGVRIILCGQSAAGLGLDETADLLPGVEVALSAMTAHALLQQDGYTVNPF
ncbi:DsrE family protein [Altererythrobacter sp. MTPC7]|uniref:DsrE family protein n=1 Tax=Altererythrobacter sp. MTPC7 TaxID=3056567 RepID=UPI0036F35C98